MADIYIDSTTFPAAFHAPNWMATAEISPWESTSANISLDDIVYLLCRMDRLERRVETLMKRIDELGLTDVSDLI